MPNYYRNVDDAISDPELIAAKYLIGRSAYFEVQLTLAELSDNIASIAGGISGSPVVISAVGYESPTINPQCPTLDQYIWVEKDEKPWPLMVKTVLKDFSNHRLYNPVTGNFNKIVDMKQGVQPTFEIFSQQGIMAKVSTTHKLIMNTQDHWGTAVRDYVIGKEILMFQHPQNIFSDILFGVKDIGKEKVAEIKLEKEFLYICGATKKHGFVSHNQKPVDILI